VGSSEERDGFYGVLDSGASRRWTASAVWRRERETEGSAETAAAVSTRVEGVEGVEEVEGVREVEEVEEVERTQSSRMRSAVVREEEG